MCQMHVIDRQIASGMPKGIPDRPGWASRLGNETMPYPGAVHTRSANKRQLKCISPLLAIQDHREEARHCNHLEGRGTHVLLRNQL